MSYRKRSNPQYGYNPRRRSLFQVVSLPITSRHSFRVQKWQVRSHSDPSKHYTVSLRKDSIYECSCPQWIYRHKECKHIVEVKNLPVSTAATPKEVVVVYDKEGIGRLVV